MYCWTQAHSEFTKEPTKRSTAMIALDTVLNRNSYVVGTENGLFILLPLFSAAYDTELICQSRLL